jgi:GT2 family glycosyltransferase
LISAVVPTFRGRERIERNLKSVAAALSAAAEPWEILIVDDGGGEIVAPVDGSRVVILERNRGYGPAVNAGVAAARGEHLLVLNDDVRLEESAVAILRGRFPDRTLFAAVPSIRSPLARCGDEGGKRARWEAGLIEFEEAARSDVHPTAYPVGCCFLCRRDVFLELGGFDEAFAPFLFEDVDLGYRAWRRGLATLQVPGAVCHHEGSATIGQRSMDERQRAWCRNRALFHLRNLQSPRLRAASLGALAALLLFDGRAAVRDGVAAGLAEFNRLGRRAAAGASDGAILARMGDS